MANHKTLMWEHLSKFQELKEVRIACDRLMKTSMVDKQVMGQVVSCCLRKLGTGEI